jgi:hypothetical protein
MFRAQDLRPDPERFLAILPKRRLALPRSSLKDIFFQVLCPKGEEMPILFANPRKDKSALSRNSRIRARPDRQRLLLNAMAVCAADHDALLEFAERVRRLPIAS